jgi:hypothetical protein
MSISLISPLSVQECISRLEEARKKDASLLRWSVSSKSFTLRKNQPRSVAQIRGELSDAPEGTLIKCSMEADQKTSMLSSLWLMTALPLFTCVALGLLLNGLLNGFSRELILLFLLISSVPAFYLLQRQLGIHRTERDQREMLDFIQKTLDARPVAL